MVLFVLGKGNEGILNVVLDRFKVASGDINKLTTGRFNLWSTYWKYLWNNPRSFLCGEGIGASLLNGKGPHNVYVEILYHLGAIGGILLLCILRQISRLISRWNKKNIMNYSILLCIIIMYFFLSELFYFDAPFHLCIAFVVLNMNLDVTEQDKF